MTGLAPSSKLDVAVVQMTSVDDWAKGFEQVSSVLDAVASRGPCDLVCFPENCLYFRTGDASPFESIDLGDARLKALSAKARAANLSVHLGSVPLAFSQAQGAKALSASVLIRSSGEISAEYRKMHLFDVDVEGHRPVRESDVFEAGRAPFVFDLHGWKIASSICYDLRFAELYAGYARAGADVILIPSAFLVPTGKAHWDVLTRARAIESQAFVIAAAQGGRHVGAGGAARETWGHARAIGPWGEVLVEIDSSGLGTLSENRPEPRFERVTLQRSELERTRRQIPMARHRVASLLR